MPLYVLGTVFNKLYISSWVYLQKFQMVFFLVYFFRFTFIFIDSPSITIHKITNTVEEGDNITLTCNTSGKPQPVITWTKLGSSEVLSNTSLLTIVNVSRPGTPDNMIQYQCTASNGVETPATDTTTVTVHCELVFLNEYCMLIYTTQFISYLNLFCKRKKFM